MSDALAPYLREVQPVPLDSLWDGHILGSLFTYWAGKEGVGKGLFLADVHTRLALGWPMPPWHPDDAEAPPGLPPCQSIIIELEDDGSEVWRRVAAAAGPAHRGEALRRIVNFSEVKRQSSSAGALTETFTIPEDLPLLGEQIRRMNRHDLDARTRDVASECEGCGAQPGEPCAVLGPVKLVSLGPISGLSSVSVSWSTQQVRRKLVMPMTALCRQLGVGLLGVGHFWRGANPSNFRDKIGGSKAWLDAARLLNVIWPDPDDPKTIVLAPEKSNYGEPADAAVRFRVEAHGYADPDAHVVYPARPGGAGKPEQRIGEMITEALADAAYPVDYRQLAAWLGLTADVVKHVAVTLVRAGQLAMTPDGRLSLPAAIAAATPRTVPVVAHKRARPRAQAGRSA